MAENPEPKIATDPDWFWRDPNAGRGAGLYGEILPERPKAAEDVVLEAAPVEQAVAL